ncbi:MAG: hypothetical protein BroJett011_04000 [Chloroflexota bacterium]|nr:MAG: hypothetical protein BroJett011_04000 [Chloroflexota bacterium]
MYRFSLKNGQIAEGYVQLDIMNGLAQVDPENSDQVALAKKHGGKPARVRKAKAASEKPAA